LLFMILGSLVFQLAAPEADWARVVAIVIQGLTLLVALVASRVHPLILSLATIAVCAAILASAAALIGFGTLGPTAARLITALLVALAPASIARAQWSWTSGRAASRFTRCSGPVHLSADRLAVRVRLRDRLERRLGGLLRTAGRRGHHEELPLFQLDHDRALRRSHRRDEPGALAPISEALLGQIYLVTVVAAIVGGLSRRRQA
jgi:hypothetical protein